MNLSLYIARRYLFSKKSHNAINIISMVAVCGVAVATLATVCTMSVFNGFQGLVGDMYSTFDPELKITPVKGKVFDPGAEKILQLHSFPEIDLITETLGDNILVRYKERQVPAILKGVSDNFDSLTQIKNILIDGEFKLKEDINSFGTLGIGLASSLGVNAGFVYPLEIYAPKRNVQVSMINPSSSFTQDYVYIGGVFQTSQPVYDENYLIVPLSMARTLLDYPTEVSSLEIKLKEGAKTERVQKTIEKLLGSEFQVKNHYQQQEAAFKMMNIEKWVSFLMLCFILVIAAFNIIGSLSMLIIDKQRDVLTLRNLGADNQLISRIFLFEGWMISAIGALTGVVLGVLLCLGQQRFGWLRLGSTEGAFVVNAYPVRLDFGDLLFTLLAVLLIGFLSVLYPVRYLSKKSL